MQYTNIGGYGVFAASIHSAPPTHPGKNPPHPQVILNLGAFRAWTPDQDGTSTHTTHLATHITSRRAHGSNLGTQYQYDSILPRILSNQGMDLSPFGWNIVTM